jgi:hypothetical protein
VTENGYGKRTRIDEYPLQNRGGKGVITIKTTERNGPVVGALVVDDSDEVMLVSDQGNIIRMKVGGISVIGRNTQGVKLINLAEGERLVAVASLAEPEENDDDDPLPSQNQTPADSPAGHPPPSAVIGAGRLGHRLGRAPARPGRGGPPMGL